MMGRWFACLIFYCVRWNNKYDGVEMVRTPSRGLGLSSRRLLRDRSTT